MVAAVLTRVVALSDQSGSRSSDRNPEWTAVVVAARSFGVTARLVHEVFGSIERDAGNGEHYLFAGGYDYLRINMGQDRDQRSGQKRL
jgi:hypothetical protein